MSRRIPTVLTDEELAAIYGKINEATTTGKRDRALLQTMADTGLRVSEALAVETKDLRRENGRITAITVRAGKGDKDRTVFPTPQLSDKILRWLDARTGLGIRNGQAPVFCTVKHGAGQRRAAAGPRALTARTVQELVARLAQAAGLEKQVTPHTLRHTCATRTLKATGNLRIVQDNLGHSRLETTRIYTHVQDAERQAAAQALTPVDGEEAPAPDPLAQIAEALAALPKEAREKLVAALK
jgi:integrase/recombinase XerD